MCNVTAVLVNGLCNYYVLAMSSVCIYVCTCIYHACMYEHSVIKLMSFCARLNKCDTAFFLVLSDHCKTIPDVRLIH